MLVASEFAKRLRELRTAAGISQYALAKKAGISKQAINRLESGDSEPTWDTVKKLARALGVSILEFDDEVEGKTEESDRKPPAKKKPKK